MRSPRAWKVVPVIIAREIWSVSISVEWMRVVLNGFLITRGRVCVWNISGADCVSNDKENTSNVSHVPFGTFAREDKRVVCLRDLHSIEPMPVSNFRLPSDLSNFRAIRIYSGMRPVCRIHGIGSEVKQDVVTSRRFRGPISVSIIIYQLDKSS